LADGTGILRGVNTIFARTSFAQSNPKLIQIVLEQYARAAKALRDTPETETAKIAAAFSLEPKQLQKVVAKYNYPVVITHEDIQSLRETTSFLRNIGVVTDSKFDIANYIDDSYGKAANLKQYQ